MPYIRAGLARMANPEHLEVVRKGKDAIAEWRQANRGVRLDLSEADLSQANLAGGASLSGAHFFRANLAKASLAGASLAWADLTFASLQHANLDKKGCGGGTGRVGRCQAPFVST